jgi:glycosyltransferase involved in cell wall biosynthesis
MTRVGFILYGLNNWLGGINYFVNLIQAISDLPRKKIEPVLFAGHTLDNTSIDKLPSRYIHYSKLFDGWSSPKLNKLHYLYYNLATNLVLKKYHVDVLSHANFSGLRLPTILKIPALGWIPDFQHKHLPRFFSSREIQLRDQEYLAIARNCDRIVLSSFAAQKDFSTFFSDYAKKSRVLQFAVPPVTPNHSPALPELERKYGFHGPFFFVPNHFWIHKNHRLLLEALKILQDQGLAIQIIATGKTDDYRHQDHFPDLMSQAKEYGVAPQFKVLGIIPYPDLTALLEYAVALINPSFFEGWSSTVEEAKSLGKKVILSDIPVHREQNPRRAVFFKPDDAPGLAQALREAWESFRPKDEPYHYQRAVLENKRRWLTFGEQYQEIVIELIAEGS